uniref:Ribosomal protein S12 n=1 Tax=Carex agglomerata TaxID=2802308 RepID=A0A8B0SDG5_9POAL|nr:ribosomal protein S12 [Carex agglomerata]QTX08839.1 ribosomal protein S12 [Carex agglomerata]
MPTITQLLRNIRQPKKNGKKSPALKGCPQRRGTCALSTFPLSTPKNQTLPYVKLPEYDSPLDLKSLLIYQVFAIVYKNILLYYLEEEGSRIYPVLNITLFEDPYMLPESRIVDKGVLNMGSKSQKKKK